MDRGHRPSPREAGGRANYGSTLVGRKRFYPPPSTPRNGSVSRDVIDVAKVVHRLGSALAEHVRRTHPGNMTDPRLWVLPLFLTLLLFPVSPLRTTPAVASGQGPWRWPLDPPVEVLRGFDPPEERWLPGHLGVDLAAEPGQSVYPAGPGRVRFAGSVAGVGVVSVTHGETHTTYSPVAAAVSRGDPVGAEPIGVVAAEPRHCAERTCLHWGLLRGRTYLDPLSLLGRGEVRLLPVPANTTAAATRTVSERGRGEGGTERGVRRAGGPVGRHHAGDPPRRACRSGCCAGWRGPGTPARCAGRRHR